MDHSAADVRVVDVYQVMCHVLRIHCPPNDGRWSAVSQMLVNGAATSHDPHTMGQRVLLQLWVPRSSIAVALYCALRWFY